jgi:hypothetical protein
MENTPQMPPAYRGPADNPSQSPSFQAAFQEYSSAPTQQAYQQAPLNQPYPQYQQYPQTQPNQGARANPQTAAPKRKAGRYSWLRNASGKALMIRGALMAVVGIVITAVSYANAQSQADSGGTGYYVVFTGLIVFGVIYFFIGLFRWLATRRRR